MTRFCRFQLRTTNVDAARAFYATLLGDDGADIVPLPAEAAARGAPAHWLGHLGVDDVERTAGALVERGAIRLGPTRPTADGGTAAILRDPGGAVMAVATPPATPARVNVVWHQHHSTDLARSIAAYRELFGWQFTDRLDLGELGVHHQFAWHEGGVSVGAMADIAEHPGIHPQWLFHFSVAALAPAMAAVSAAGGLVIGPMVLPDGHRVAVCDDPQGAAFAMRERLPSAS